MTAQVWWIMPVKINRKRGDHPCPFPEKLPGRLIRMYTYGPSANFPGEIVLDPFAGSGTTCAVAKKMGRRFLGVEIDERFAEMARRRVEGVKVGDPIGDNFKPRSIEEGRGRGGNLADLMIGKPRWPTKSELADVTTRDVAHLDRVAAEKKYKQKTFGTKMMRVADGHVPD